MVESDSKQDGKQKVSFSAVLGSLLSGSSKVSCTADVLDRFHKAGEVGDRDLPMKAVIRDPHRSAILEVNAAHCKSIGFNKCAELRRVILDSELRMSVGGDRGKWREKSLDTCQFGMVQEFEIKKRSKDKQLLGIT